MQMCGDECIINRPPSIQSQAEEYFWKSTNFIPISFVAIWKFNLKISESIEIKFRALYQKV